MQNISSNKINYQKELEKLLAEPRDKTPHLLLHSCCAPCSSYVISYLSEYMDITVLYYNPNITEREEYNKRAAEQKRLISEMPTKHSVTFLEGKYDENIFFDAVRGYESCREGGDRCKICYRLRLEECARLASEGKYDYFSTTLTISPLKNAQAINAIGYELAEKYLVNWLPSDFKKNEGYKKSIELSKIYSLYRQNYCGCVFSQITNGEKQMNLEEKTLTTELVFNGKIFRVKRLTVELPNKNTAMREIVEHNGGVCVLPLTDDNKVIFVRQFRCPYGENLLEIPAGKLEKGENHFDAGKRELLEETGCKAKDFSFLGELYPTPGYCGEKIYMYFAKNLTKESQHLDDDEFLNVEEIPLDSALDMVMNGEIKDSKTQAALLKVARIIGK